ncbi:MAG: hypothetical protein Q4A71_01125 [Actinomycetaceae bacterium]|nr:hypothetical protein [Actinomycetaceae bacterium]
MKRRSSLRDYTAFVWLIAGGAVLIMRPVVPSATWLMVHLVMLGALTHSAFVWSEYFTHAILRTRATPMQVRRARQRIIVLIIGTLLVLVGIPLTSAYGGGHLRSAWTIVAAGAGIIIAAIGWHTVFIWREFTRALPGRFNFVTRYYGAASLFLILGNIFGASISFGVGEATQARLLAAHLAANFLGWIGLTVIGTLITFWSTMLRTQMAPHTARFSARLFPVFVASDLTVITGALLGMLPLAVGGFAVYLLALVVWASTMWTPLRKVSLREFAPASVAAGLTWAVVGLGGVLLVIYRSSTWSDFDANVRNLSPILVAGFALQLLIGALSYLMPMVMGGGPAVSRAMNTQMNRYGVARVILTNAGLILAITFSHRPALHIAGIVLAGIGFLAFFSATKRALSAFIKAKKEAPTSATKTATDTSPSEKSQAPTAGEQASQRAIDRRWGQLQWAGSEMIGAIAIIAVVLSVGAVVDRGEMPKLLVVRAPLPPSRLLPLGTLRA